jgi:hypothetical protein
MSRYKTARERRARRKKATKALNATLRRFLIEREKGVPPVDPDAEQLARDVGRLCDELAGVQ